MVWQTRTSQNTMSMAVRKDFPLKPFLSNQILKLIDFGHIKHVSQRLVVPEKDCSPVIKQVEPLTIHMLASLLFFLLTTILFSALILSCEILFYKHVAKQTQDAHNGSNFQKGEKLFRLISILQVTRDPDKKCQEIVNVLNNLALSLSNNTTRRNKIMRKQRTV